jgi:glycosyltransferase involved in cell wall biosynthesis
MNELRTKVLRFAYSISPFDICGDASMPAQSSLTFSCIIPTYNRARNLDNILHCLSTQDIPTDQYEVIIVEDGKSDEVVKVVNKYCNLLNLNLIFSGEYHHSVGSLRNIALNVSCGKYLLFLDDDTQIWQTFFLSKLKDNFDLMPDVNCIQIAGKSDRCLIKPKYFFLDEFSFATRCVAYRREIIRQIGGFIDSLLSYEDIELSIRFSILDGRVFKDMELYYLHPPLFFSSWRKPLANGLSFLTLFSRYSILVWMLCFLNATRFLPLLMSFSIRHRQWAKISAGFIIAPLYNLFWGNKNQILYR